MKASASTNLSIVSTLDGLIALLHVIHCPRQVIQVKHIYKMYLINHQQHVSLASHVSKHLDCV